MLMINDKKNLRDFINENLNEQINNTNEWTADQMLQDEVEPNAKTFTALIYTFTNIKC